MLNTACTTVTSKVQAVACDTSSPPTIWHMVPLSPRATEWVLVLLAMLLVTLLADGPGKK